MPILSMSHSNSTCLSISLFVTALSSYILLKSQGSHFCFLAFVEKTTEAPSGDNHGAIWERNARYSEEQCSIKCVERSFNSVAKKPVKGVQGYTVFDSG